MIVDPKRGRVDVETIDQRIDKDTCKHEALSGMSIISSGAHRLVLTYDGATDCDEVGTVRWAVDGEPRGELHGVKSAADCSVNDPSERVGFAPLILLVGCSLRRRRRSRAGSR